MFLKSWSIYSRHLCQTIVSENSHVSAGSEFCDDFRVPEAHVYTLDRDRARSLKRACGSVNEKFDS